MSSKPDLVLDIAGVLATNLSPHFWNDLSLKFEVPYEKLIQFKKETRKELWTGEITEKDFWLKLNTSFPSVEINYAKSKLKSIIKPLPALKQIPLWSQYANIHLLSNHRIEWIQHILAEVKPYMKSITISGEAGCCKPDRAIYLKVGRYLDKKHILFVDDQEKNLKEARNLGWNTLLADTEGAWVEKVVCSL
ncbi:HAD-IA family hydrolase [Priestia sp. YIM B13489]|uniref:HAD-IA family hydrolase n=1 Tax=Priestia sp. YIM B13489 TaxID=3366313 RepID=UPI00367201CF